MKMNNHNARKENYVYWNHQVTKFFCPLNCRSFSISSIVEDANQLVKTAFRFGGSDANTFRIEIYYLAHVFGDSINLFSRN